MTPTTYGYRNPDVGDLAVGSNGWYSSLNYNILRQDSHDHDGVNSTLLTIANLAPFSTTILASAWVTDGVGGFTQTVTAPAAITEINNFNIKFIFLAPSPKVGDVAYLGYTRLSGSTYEVYCNDSTAAFTAIYR